MPNKWYNRGRAFEYKVKTDLETIGWIVFRMAGSHTCADLIALRPRRVLLVQCKNASTPYLPPKERKRLQYVAKRLNVTAVVAYKISRAQIAYKLMFKKKAPRCLKR